MRAQVKRQECHEAQGIYPTVSSDIMFVRGWHLRTQVEITNVHLSTRAQVKQANSCISKHKDYTYNSHVVPFVVVRVVAPDGVGPTHYVAHPPVTDTRILAKLSPLREPQQRRITQENKPEESGDKA